MGTLQRLGMDLEVRLARSAVGSAFAPQEEATTPTKVRKISGIVPSLARSELPRSGIVIIRSI
jgi:hypothetical protein